MRNYIIRRFLTIIFVVVAAAFVIFTLTYFIPGDPALNILGASASEADLAAKRHALGVDRPYLEQLGTYLFNTFIRFDLGNSWIYNVPVLQELAARMPRTLILGVPAMVITVSLGILLGVFAGTHEGKWQDAVTMVIAIFFASAPSFWVSLMFIILFSVKLQLLPSFGCDTWQCYIMPILSSCLGGTASNARQQRNAILEVFRADFITTARAKGLPEKDVIRRHMLPNSLMPVITNLGGLLCMIVCGSAITETVFSIPGVGLYLLNSVNSRDYPAIRGSVLFFAIFTAVTMLVIDLVYAAIDPRIKVRYVGNRKKKEA